MAIPAAIVSIQLREINGIRAALLAGTNRVYALTKIGTRQLGRTAVISSNGAFTLNRWLDVAVASGDSIHVEVELWEDREDLAPNRLAQITGDIGPPWTSRRYDFGSIPGVICNVTTRPVPGGGGALGAPRSTIGGPVAMATLSPTRAFCVEITEILGLYEPGYSPPGPGPAQRAAYHAGYTSEDQKGRIYLNRDLTGAWAHDTQLIQLTARVTAPLGAFPASPQIRWVIFDPDDPFDDQPETHRQWAPYIDGNDYTGGTPLGATGDDNEGTFDHSPRWEEAPGGYTLSITSNDVALTNVVGQLSKVKVHCPNVAGDNLTVRAFLEPASVAENFQAETGIMTMWSRVDVDYIKMTSAFDIPVADVSAHLEAAFIQLDFAPVVPVADRQFMGPSDAGLETACVSYVNANFPHKTTHGWFCVIAAMEPHPLPSAGGPPRTLFSGDTTVHHGGAAANQADYIDIPGHHSNADYVEFSWGANSVGFSVSAAQIVGSQTRCWLEPHDAQDQFTAGDGSINHAYQITLDFFPTGRLEGATWMPGGYGVPDPVHVKVFEPGAFYTAGISPTVSVGGRRYFAGRTLIFTHHGHYRDRVTHLPRANFAADSAQTVAHELTHAFGMPHKCGYWDWLAPRAHTCCMNYSPNWMLDALRQLAPGTSGKVGADLCGRHAKELRRVHLEDNGGLGW